MYVPQVPLDSSAHLKDAFAHIQFIVCWSKNTHKQTYKRTPDVLRYKCIVFETIQNNFSDTFYMFSGLSNLMPIIMRFFYKMKQILKITLNLLHFD